MDHDHDNVYKLITKKTSSKNWTYSHKSAKVSKIDFLIFRRLTKKPTRLGFRSPLLLEYMVN